jgi:hypothetical protein
MYTFDIIIENLKKRITQLHALHIMAGLLVLVYGLRGFSDLPKTSMQLYTGLPVAIAILFISFFKKHTFLNLQQNQLFRILEAAFITMAALHFFKYNFTITGVGFLITAVLILFMLMIENQILGGFTIAINDAGVIRNMGLQKKTITWAEIQNVILRDGILTIDLKNNYLMQSKVKNEMTEQEIFSFNNYCTEKLIKD